MASEPLSGEGHMLVGERWISRPMRVWYVAILIPLLGVPGTAKEITGPSSGVHAIATLAVGNMQTKLVYLQPGLLIGEKAPEGWSHLVVKSMPRLASGDKDSLPKDAAKTAAYFRTVILANVKPVDVDEKEFELTQVGIGICVPRKGQNKDVVVAADRLEALGLHLSWVQKMTLDAMEAGMAKGRIIAATPTFALFRSPATVVAAGNEHREVNLNYAFCIDRGTGKLLVGLWTSALEAHESRSPQTMVRLNSNPVFDCKMDVQTKKLFGVTVPGTWSFAMSELPAGKRVAVPRDLGEMIAMTSRRPNEADVESLEEALCQVLVTVAEPEKLAAPDKSVRRTAIPPPLRRVE
jgi:hypothetical protein